MKLFKKKSKYPDRVKDLETIKAVFDQHGVRFFLVYGALLGMYRDGDFIGHDDDIDIAVIDDIDLKTRKSIGWALYDLGFIPQQMVFNVFGRWEPCELGYNGDHETGIIVCERKFKFTIFFFKVDFCNKHNFNEYVCVPRLGAPNLIATPLAFFQKTDKIKINGKEYLTPAPIEKYLEVHYKNWKNPNDRDHSPTFMENHQEEAEAMMMNLEGKNQVIKYENN